MTMPEEYGRCRACGAVCDGDVCDSACEHMANMERADQREAAGFCRCCGEQPIADQGLCYDCGNDEGVDYGE